MKALRTDFGKKKIDSRGGATAEYLTLSVGLIALSILQ